MKRSCFLFKASLADQSLFAPLRLSSTVVLVPKSSSSLRDLPSPGNSHFVATIQDNNVDGFLTKYPFHVRNNMILLHDRIRTAEDEKHLAAEQAG